MGGSLGDLYGRRRIFTIGLIGFAVSSLVCAISNSVELLVAARFVQGVFGALVVPGSLAIINNAFAKHNRAKAIGTWTAASAAVNIAGPTFGGFLVTHSSWRVIFLINIPIIALSVLFSFLGIKESRVDNGNKHIDYVGAMLAIASLGFFSGGLIMYGQNSSSAALLVIAVGVVLTPLFFIWELRYPHPIVEFSLFRNRNFSASNLMTFLFYGGLAGLFFGLAQQLIDVANFTPQNAGAATIPVPIMLVLLSSRMGKLSQKYGPRLFMSIGPLICALGVALLYNVGADTTYLTDVFPGIILFALGLSIVVAPLTATVMASADDKYSGLASGINNSVSRVSGSLVIATLGLLSVATLYHSTIILCVALMASAGIVSFIGIDKKVLES